MKILYVMGFYLPDHEYREKYYANEIKKRGHTIKLITSDVYYEFNNIKGIIRKKIIKKIRSLDEEFVIRRKAPFYFKDKILFRIKDIIQDFKPDIIHTFEATQYQPFIVARLAYKYKIPLIYEHEQRAFGTSILAKIDSFITPIILREVVKVATGIRVVNEEALDFIKKYIDISKKEIDVSTLGYNPKRFFYNLKIRKKTREDLNIKDGEILAITSGKNLREKRVDLIIKALSNIKNVKIIVIGTEKFDGAYKNLPLLKTDDLNKLYNAADICIWTRYTISYFQALGTGCDILIPRTKYTLKLSNLFPEKIHTFEILSNENHYLYQMNEEEIIKNIKESFEKVLIIKKKKYKDNRLSHSEKAQEKFSWPAIIRELEKFYYKILNKY